MFELRGLGKASAQDIPDWRHVGDYAWLLRADAPAFAWEWLRRREDYRKAFLRPSRPIGMRPGVIREQPEARQWGLHTFEDPSLSGPEARPIWMLNVHPFVLEAQSERTGPEREGLEFDHIWKFASLALGYSKQHLLLSNGQASVRLDIAGSSLTTGPVFLRYGLSGGQAALAPLLVLQRFLALVGSGHFLPELHEPYALADRNVTLLRAFDAASVGADQRAIAEELLDGDTREMRWRVEEASVRLRCQRLLNESRGVSTSYLRFLK